jgi:hypothetical protein
VSGQPSPEQMTVALRRARTSFSWFCQFFWQVKNKDGEFVKFTPNPPQARLIRLIEEKGANGQQVKVLILKARQMGFSTVCQAYLAWQAFCFKGQSGLTVAHKEEPSGELFKKIEDGWERLPGWFQPKRRGKTTGKRLQLGPTHNEALLYVDHAMNKDAGRSQTFQNAHLSEVAFWQDAADVLTSMTPTLERAKVIFGESTANGMGNHFYELWKGAEHGEGSADWNGWIAFFAPWFEMPEYRRERNALDQPLSADERAYAREFGLDEEQMLWRRSMIRTLGEDKFNQEYPDTPLRAFLTSGSGFFTPKTLDYYRSKVAEPERKGEFKVKDGRPKFIDDPNGPLWIWEPPQGEATYVVSADIASGGARDYTAVQVIKVGDVLEQVAAYRGKCDPDEAATLIDRIARVYSPGRGIDRRWALVAPERNVIGMTTIGKLRDVLHYPRLYTHRHVDTVDYRESKEYGWLTTPKARRNALEHLKELCREAAILIRCSRTFEEMETFIYTPPTRDGGEEKPAAPRGGWDDMVMSLAIGAAVSERVPTGPAVWYSTNDDPISDAIGY